MVHLKIVICIHPFHCLNTQNFCYTNVCWIEISWVLVADINKIGWGCNISMYPVLHYSIMWWVTRNFNLKEGLAYQRRSGEIFCFGIGLKNKYSSFHLLHILLNKTFQHLKCTIIALPQKSYFCHITLFNDPYILVPHCLCALKVPVYPYRWGLVGAMIRCAGHIWGWLVNWCYLCAIFQSLSHHQGSIQHWQNYKCIDKDKHLKIQCKWIYSVDEVF